MSAATLRRPFESLSIPNYRRWFAGLVVSISGNWMQTVAELWLVLTITGSALAVGVTTALQFLPMLIAGAWGGLVADRHDKRRLLILTQALMALPALALWALTASGSVELWMIFALVFARGAVNAVDNPARHAFLIELVGPDRLVNAVGLNSAIIHTARVLGPALAGVVIAGFGVATCFALNGISFAATLISLRMLDPDRLHPAEVALREKGQLRSGFAYVRRTPELRVPLALMAVAGTFSFNFQVLLPLLARFSFDGDASVYAAFTAAMGAGAVVGALTMGARGRVSPRFVALSAIVFGAVTVAAASAPTIGTEMAALAVTGAASVVFASAVASTLQLTVEPSMRGRVMALFSIVYLGSTPIGGPLAAWMAHVAGPRAALLMGALAAGAAGLAGLAVDLGGRGRWRLRARQRVRRLESRAWWNRSTSPTGSDSCPPSPHAGPGTRTRSTPARRRPCSDERSSATPASTAPR